MTTGTISIAVGILLLILLKVFFKDDGQMNLNKEESEDVNIVEEDPWSDPGWSTLSGNLFNDDK